MVDGDGVAVGVLLALGVVATVGVGLVVGATYEAQAVRVLSV
jgi:hypothetical protein